MPQLIRGKKLLQKGEEEGINMHYLYLRSDFREYSLRKPLEKQIAKKEGIKWDVIRTRLGIDKTKSKREERLILINACYFCRNPISFI